MLIYHIPMDRAALVPVQVDVGAAKVGTTGAGAVTTRHPIKMTVTWAAVDTYANVTIFQK